MSDSRNELESLNSPLTMEQDKSVNYGSIHLIREKNLSASFDDYPQTPAFIQATILQISTKIIRLGVPMAFSYTFTASMVAAAMMITRLKEESSDDYLATAMLVAIMTHILACVAMSPFFAMSTIGSEKYGQLLSYTANNDAVNVIQSKNEIAKLFKSGIILSTLIIPLPFAAMFFSDYILSAWFGQNKIISGLVQQNLRAYSFAMPGLIYRTCVEQILFSFEKSHHTMAMGLSAFAVGTAFSYYFAFGPPNLGLAGIAYGYVIESYLTCLSYGAYMHFHESFKNIPFFKPTWLNQEVYQQNRTLLKMGMPITLQTTCELSAMMLIGFYAGWLGKESSAAQNFSTQLFSFAVIPSDAFAQTLSQEVSRLIGQSNFRDASRFARYGILTNIGLMSLVCIPVSIAPKVLMYIFASKVNSNVMNIAKYLIPIAVGQTLTETAGFSMTQTLRSAGDLYKPTMIKITCLWAGVLIAYLLGFQSSLGIYGVNIGFLIGVALGTTALIPRWTRQTSSNYLENFKMRQESPRISEASEKFFHKTQCSIVENAENAENLENGFRPLSTLSLGN